MFSKMPLGLSSTPGSLQWTIHVVELCVKWQFALMYLDKFILSFRNADEHRWHVRSLIWILHKYSVTIILKKGKLFTGRIDYRWHILLPNILKEAHHTTDTISDLKPPCKVSKSKYFLDLFSIYRRLVSNLAPISAAFNDKCKTIDWGRSSPRQSISTTHSKGYKRS